MIVAKDLTEEDLATAQPQLMKTTAHAEHFSRAMSKPASSACLSQRQSDRKIVKKEKIQPAQTGPYRDR
jgi:hypothetical protein